MHELSLSYATVDSALESIAHLDAIRVKSITLTAGELSGVAIEAFRFSFPIAAAGTVFENAELIIHSEPVRVFCSACNSVTQLPDLQHFRCGACGLPTGDVRTGKDFCISAIEVETNEVPVHDYAHC